jgi:hypothetical protein
MPVCKPCKRIPNSSSSPNGDIVAHTRASRFGAAALRSQLDRPDRQVLDELTVNEIRAIENMNRWHEMTQHHWKAFKALIEVGGRSDLRDLFIAAGRWTKQEPAWTS